MSIPLLITGYASIYKCKRDEHGHYSQEKMQNSNHKLDDVPLFPSNKDGHFFQKSGLKSMVDPLPLPMNFQVKMPDFLSATVMLEEASQMF